MQGAKPHPNESLSGYLRRCAHDELYDTVAPFYARLEVRYGRPLLGQLSTVATKLQLESSVLEEIAPVSGAAKGQFPLQFERSSCDPLCPHCLCENGFWDISWRHCYVSACPRHGARLVDRCGRCGTQITPATGGFLACECGAPFAEFPVSQASDAELAISTMLVESRWGTGTQPPASFDRFIHFLHGSVQSSRLDKPGKAKQPRSTEDAASLAKAVWPMLEDPQEAFAQLINAKLLDSPDRDITLPMKLGGWYQSLSRFREPWYDPFWAVVRSFGTGQSKSPCGQVNNQITAKEAAAILSVRADRIVEAVHSGKIGGEIKESALGHRRTWVDRAEIEKIAIERARYWDAKTTAEFLGVSKKQFALLVNSGFIAPVERSSLPPLADGVFKASELQSLTETIRAGVVSPAGDGTTIRFADINQRQTTDLRGVKRVFSAIKAGQLRAVFAPSDNALGAFSYSNEEVRALLDSPEQNRFYTARQVSQICGWKHECVTHWCREDLLESRKSKSCGADSYEISPEALAAFQSMYVVLSDVAKLSGTSSRRLITICGARGVETVAKNDGLVPSRCFLVKVADLFA